MMSSGVRGDRRGKEGWGWSPSVEEVDNITQTQLPTNASMCEQPQVCWIHTSCLPSHAKEIGIFAKLE